MNTPTLIKHESPAGPYWYHPDHPDCQDGKVLWEEPSDTPLTDAANKDGSINAIL